MIHQSLGFLMGAASRWSKRLFDQTLKEYDITAVQWAILKHLEECGKCSQNQIAESLYMDKASVGTIIEKLIKKEMVIREKSEDDRRAYHVFLTKKAKQVVQDLTSIAEETNEKSFGNMSQEERTALKALLQKVIENLDKELK